MEPIVRRLILRLGELITPANTQAPLFFGFGVEPVQVSANGKAVGVCLAQPSPDEPSQGDRLSLEVEPILPGADDFCRRVGNLGVRYLSETPLDTEGCRRALAEFTAFLLRGGQPKR